MPTKAISHDLHQKFEFYSYGHALAILNHSFSTEWAELQDCLRKLEISVDDLKQQGGNETNRLLAV